MVHGWSMTSSAVLGEVSCLVAALCWALAVTLFRRPIAAYGAQAVNLGKNTIAAVLLGVTALLAGQIGDLTGAPPTAVLLVAASGLVGMTLGDTALFAAVHRVGVHRALLLQTLAPVFTAALAFAVRGEQLTLPQVGGAVAILLGIALVVTRRGAARDARPLAWAGIAFGVLAAFGQGAGVVLAKVGMEEVRFLAAGFVRLTAAALGLVVWMAATRNARGIGAVLGSTVALRRLLGPSLIGTYVAVLLMMLGIALAPAAIAAVLLATSPVFSLFIEARLEKAPITARAVVGTLLAVAGVSVITATGG